MIPNPPRRNESQLQSIAARAVHNPQQQLHTVQHLLALKVAQIYRKMLSAAALRGGNRSCTSSLTPSQREFVLKEIDALLDHRGFKAQVSAPTRPLQGLSVTNSLAAFVPSKKELTDVARLLVAHDCHLLSDTKKAPSTEVKLPLIEQRTPQSVRSEQGGQQAQSARGHMPQSSVANNGNGGAMTARAAPAPPAGGGGAIEQFLRSPKSPRTKKRSISDTDLEKLLAEDENAASEFLKSSDRQQPRRRHSVERQQQATADLWAQIMLKDAGEYHQEQIMAKRNVRRHQDEFKQLLDTQMKERSELEASNRRQQEEQQRKDEEQRMRLAEVERQVAEKKQKIQTMLKNECLMLQRESELEHRREQLKQKLEDREMRKKLQKDITIEKARLEEKRRNAMAEAQSAKEFNEQMRVQREEQKARDRELEHRMAQEAAERLRQQELQREAQVKKLHERVARRASLYEKHGAAIRAQKEEEDARVDKVVEERNSRVQEMERQLREAAAKSRRTLREHLERQLKERSEKEEKQRREEMEERRKFAELAVIEEQRAREAKMAMKARSIAAMEANLKQRQEAQMSRDASCNMTKNEQEYNKRLIASLASH